MELYVVVYNISSASKMLEFAKLTYGFGLRKLVLAKIFGAAAQQIGDLFKLAFKMGKEVLVLNDLFDVIDVLRPDAILALSKPDVAEPLVVPDASRLALIVHGSDFSFSQKELPQGAKVVYAVDRDIGSLGQLAIALYTLQFSHKSKGQ